MSDQEGGQLALPDSDQPDAAATEKTSRPDQPFGDMSEAARGVVHSPADPRLDRHLARFGLAEATPAAPRPSTTPAGDALVKQLAEIQASVDQSNARLRALLWAVIALFAGVVVLAVLVLSR